MTEFKASNQTARRWPSCRSCWRRSTLCSRAVVAIGFDWLAFYVSALAAARTALLLPGSLRGEFSSAGATCTQTALTVSRLSHASPRAAVSYNYSAETRESSRVLIPSRAQRSPRYRLSPLSVSSNRCPVHHRITAWISSLVGSKTAVSEQPLLFFAFG